MEITWNISTLDRRTSDGFVTTTHWTATATEGEHTASTYGACGWGEGEPEIPYDNLTKDQVLEWVWGSVDKEAIEASLTTQIEAKKNPVSATGVPWAA